MRWRDKPPCGTPIDRSRPLAAGLVRAWTLNEGQGIAFADAATGVVDSASGTTLSWESTPYGHALSWPSSGSPISDSGDWLSGRTAITVAVVAKLTTITGSNYGRMIDANGTTLLLGPQASYTVMQAYFGGNIAVFSGLPDSRNWHTYVLTWQSGSVCTLYVDGVAYTASPPSATLSTTTVRIGNNSAGNAPYLGTIAWLATWNRCLSAGEATSMTSQIWDLYRPSPGWLEEDHISYYATILVTAGDLATATDGRSGLASTTVASDAFTDASATTLASHTPSSGGSWTLHSSYSGSTAAISNANRCRSDGSMLDATSYYHSATPASADYVVSSDLYIVTTRGQAGVQARMDTSADTCYAAFIEMLGPTVTAYLVKRVAGTTTTLDSHVVTANAGDTHAILLTCQGTALSVSWDGTPIMSATDSSITTAGKAGLWLKNSNIWAGSDSYNAHIDNWQSSSVGVIATPEWVAVLIAAADSGAAIDSASILASIRVGDTASEYDSGSILSMLRIGDSGSFADSASLAALVRAIDTATVYDASRTVASLYAVDSAALADWYASKALIVAADLATLANIASIIDIPVILVTAFDSASLRDLAIQSVAVTVLYTVYGNDGAASPIDYGTALATTSGHTWSTTISVSGVKRLAVRAKWQGTSLEEQNLDAFVEVLIDGSLADVTATPAAPVGLVATSRTGGFAFAEWSYPLPTSPSKRPTGFKVYAGSPAPSYGSPVATIPYTGALSYSASLSGLSTGLHGVSVRAYNATAEEGNTVVASFTADSTPPDVPDSLLITTTSED